LFIGDGQNHARGKFVRPLRKLHRTLFSQGLTRERKVRSHKQRKHMKTLTWIICASVALTILSACEKKAALTQCATPTLTPPGGSGHNGDPIKVTIETSTLGASLSWTDDLSTPTPTHGTIIPTAKGVAPTVFGRTLKAMAFKTGLTDSPIAEGIYVGQ